MDADLQTWLTETAYYAVATAISNAGDPTYGSPVSFLCRTEYDVQFHGPMFIPREGEEQEQFTRLFSVVEIPLKSRVWFPGSSTSDTTLAYSPKRREVIRTDLGAVSHYETYF